MLDFLISSRALDALYLPAALAAAFIIWSPTEKRPDPAGIAIAAGFLAGFLLIRPFPVWPPIGDEGWIPYLLLVAMPLGLSADVPRFRLLASLLFVIGVSIITVLLIGVEAYGTRLSGKNLLMYPLLMLSGVMVFSRVIITGERSASGLSLLFASAGLTLLAFAYGTRLWLLTLALFAALLGAHLVSYRLNRRWPLSASIIAAVIWFGFAVMLIMKRDLLALPTALLFLCFFVPGFADRLAPIGSARHKMSQILGGAAVLVIARLSFHFG